MPKKACALSPEAIVQRACVVLKAMAAGQEFKISSGHKLAMHDGRIGYLVDAYKSNQSLDGPPDHQEVHFFGMSINDFLTEVEFADDDDLFLLSANKVLNDITKTKGEQYGSGSEAELNQN
ncbi:hypothetical protein ACOBQJ_03610 [Pelotomaculum propionicicum]|uniref:hypothetical protein n=1 Tax=Pelotomaculum propionicicum TaxID=258475 RepID=UPI003B7BE1DC